MIKIVINYTDQLLFILNIYLFIYFLSINSNRLIWRTCRQLTQLVLVHNLVKLSQYYNNSFGLFCFSVIEQFHIFECFFSHYRSTTYANGFCKQTSGALKPKPISRERLHHHHCCVWPVMSKLGPVQIWLAEIVSEDEKADINFSFFFTEMKDMHFFLENVRDKMKLRVCCQKI